MEHQQVRVQPDFSFKLSAQNGDFKKPFVEFYEDKQNAEYPTH